MTTLTLIIDFVIQMLYQIPSAGIMGSRALWTYEALIPKIYLLD